MGKPRKKHPEEDSIFANNPFIEGLFEWMDWPDAERLDIEQSVQRIQKLYRDFPRDEIEEFIVDWIDMGYEPENYSPAQFDELDMLTERWVADHLRKAKTSKKRKRTR